MQKLWVAPSVFRMLHLVPLGVPVIRVVTLNSFDKTMDPRWKKKKKVVNWFLKPVPLRSRICVLTKNSSKLMNNIEIWFYVTESLEDFFGQQEMTGLFAEN